VTNGVIYMTWGANAINQAENSMATLWKKAGADMPVMVVGDEEAQAHFSEDPRVQFVLIDVNPFDGQKARGFQFLAGRIKPLLAAISPFDRTLYVDADTAFKQSPKIGFDLLDRWDMVVAETETRSLVEGIAGLKECKATAGWLGTHHILYHNSGMIFWKRNERTLKLFDLWHEEWLVHACWDEQVALLRALLKSDVMFLTVPYTWNCIREKESHILHHWFGAGDARVNMRSVSHSRSSEAETRKMTRVEIAPGRLVKCYAGDEEKVRAFYQEQLKGRTIS